MSLELTKDAILGLGEILGKKEEMELVPSPRNGSSEAGLNKTIDQIKRKETTLLKYRDVQSLQLTDLKSQILERIPDKIEDAPLKDLVSAYKVFNDAESQLDGGTKEFKGIVAYLIHIENCEKEGKNPLDDGKVIDIGPGIDDDGVPIPRIKR